MKIIFNKETKTFGVHADRVNKAVHNQMINDGFKRSNDRNEEINRDPRGSRF